LALAVLLNGTTTGCIRKVLLDGTVSSTRRAASAIDTLQDFEVAKASGRAGLGTLEGMYKLSPGNRDDLYLLTKGWAGATTAFTEDEYELAEETKDDVLAAYHRARMVAGFQRARFFATKLLDGKAPGFGAAQRNTDMMNAWLHENFVQKEDAPDLTVAATAFLGLVAAGSEEPAIVGDLFIGVAIAERAVELDQTAEHSMAHVVLGGYHARYNWAELDEAKQHFDAALRITQGKNLFAKLLYATRYYCMKSDQVGYAKMLNEIVSARDPLPTMRLTNLIAMRRARRYLDNKLFQEDCGFGA
jgi:hypothetical protein